MHNNSLRCIAQRSDKKMVPQVYISLLCLGRGGGGTASRWCVKGGTGGWVEGGVLGKLEVEVGTKQNKTGDSNFQ